MQEDNQSTDSGLSDWVRGCVSLAVATIFFGVFWVWFDIPVIGLFFGAFGWLLANGFQKSGWGN